MANRSAVSGKLAKVVNQRKAILIKPVTDRGNWLKRDFGDGLTGLALLLEPNVYLIKASTGYYIDRIFEIEPLTPKLVEQYKLGSNFNFD